jgi:hypothetical protein
LLAVDIDIDVSLEVTTIAVSNSSDSAAQVLYMKFIIYMLYATSSKEGGGETYR